MIGADRAGLVGWLIDGAAAAVAGGAIAASLGLLGQTPMLSLIGAMAGGGLSLTLLRAIGPEPRCYRLHGFALPAWTDVLSPESPLLDPPRDGNVVRLHPREPVRNFVHEPSAGKEGGGSNVVDLAPDASAALKAALAELRRAP